MLALVHNSGARKVDEALQQLNDIPFDLWGGICCSATATATALLIECERNVAQMLPLLLGHAPRDAKGQRPNGQRGHQIWLPARRRRRQQRHSELQRRRWHAACGSKFVWPAATSREAAASTSTSRCHNKPIKAATRRRQFQSSDFYWVPRINCLQCAPSSLSLAGNMQYAPWHITKIKSSAASLQNHNNRWRRRLKVILYGW